MISMELQRDVPQYMAIPWLMTWVMARTVSVTREGEAAGVGGGWGHGAQPGGVLQVQARRRSRDGSRKDVLQAVYFPAPTRGRQGVSGATEDSEPRSKTLVLETTSPNRYGYYGILENRVLCGLGCFCG